MPATADRAYTGPYTISTLRPDAAGVLHMVRIATAADGPAAHAELHDAIEQASAEATEHVKHETMFAFDRRQAVIEAVGDLTDRGGRVPLTGCPLRTEILVTPAA